ncbi:MAG: hypothetical protein O7F70_11465 [Gemmatimonadetes bacterium]|nr:hypothetical protein [Gemmatimonadota bacterium]
MESTPAEDGDATNFPFVRGAQQIGSGILLPYHCRVGTNHDLERSRDRDLGQSNVEDPDV